MIQKTYKIKSREGLLKFVEDVKNCKCYKEAKTVLIKVLTAQFITENVKESRNLVRRELSKAIIVGMSLTTFMRGKSKEWKPEEPYVVVSCCFFNSTDVTILECGLEMMETCDISMSLRNKLSKIEDVKAVEVICAGKSRYIASMVETLSEGYEDVPFFGAEAGMIDTDNIGCSYYSVVNMVAGKNVTQYIIGNENYYTDGVMLIIYSGKDLHVHADYHLGWRPLGKEMKITKAVGSTCVAEIDGIPAVHVYKKYLNVEPDDYFLFNVCEFPLLINRNGCNIARIPPMYDENGWLYFGSDIFQDEKIRFSYGNPQGILHETWLASEQMRKFGPEAIFLTICGARTIFLNDNAMVEIEDYQRFHPNTVYCYGSAEIYRYKGQGGILNNAFVSIGMREGDEICVCDCEEAKHPIPTHTSPVIPLTDRLATFLKVTTDELKVSSYNFKKAAQEAEAANKAKSQFLSNMSHEIRTPINAILGMNEMILRECKDTTILEYAENIRNASNSLLGLVNDILDFSKIEAGKMEIIPVEYALSSLLNDLVNMIQKRASDKGLKFIVNADQDLPTILFGDEIRIKQVVTNILTNAVKYTEEGSVTLKVEYAKKDENEIAIQFIVQDTGIGIKEEDINKLFSAFERIEEKRNRNVEGTGLGMNITQRLLSLMGTKLEVKSVYGKGSTFSFWLSQKVMNWEPIGNFEESYHRSLSQHQTYHEKFIAPKAKILVVDDTVMNLTVVKGLLKQTKIQIFTAESGYECLHLVTKEKYDVIFLDHRMPGIDGIETLQKMNKLPNSLNKDTPVISLTANAVSGARAQYIEAGFQDYLTKPINSSALENMLIKYLPEDKVIISHDMDESTESEDKEKFKLPDWLLDVEGIDIDEGVQHCGDVESYLDALTVFAESVANGVKEIAEYFKNEDWKSYTTKVHALKSSARVIGAIELSERAKRLEDAGNSGYINEIKEWTSSLLQLYLSYESKLAPLFKVEEDNSDKPMIEEDALAEAYETMREVAASFDYDSMMFVIQSLEDYRLPESEIARYKQIKDAAAKLDWEQINKILNTAA